MDVAMTRSVRLSLNSSRELLSGCQYVETGREVGDTAQLKSKDRERLNGIRRMIRTIWSRDSYNATESTAKKETLDVCR
jgi:hypothetical protein